MSSCVLRRPILCHRVLTQMHSTGDHPDRPSAQAWRVQGAVWEKCKFMQSLTKYAWTSFRWLYGRWRVISFKEHVAYTQGWYTLMIKTQAPSIYVNCDELWVCTRTDVVLMNQDALHQSEACYMTGLKENITYTRGWSILRFTDKNTINFLLLWRDIHLQTGGKVHMKSHK